MGGIFSKADCRCRNLNDPIKNEQCLAVKGSPHDCQERFDDLGCVWQGPSDASDSDKKECSLQNVTPEELAERVRAKTSNITNRIGTIVCAKEIDGHFVEINCENEEPLQKQTFIKDHLICNEKMPGKNLKLEHLNDNMYKLIDCTHQKINADVRYKPAVFKRGRY